MFNEEHLAFTQFKLIQPHLHKCAVIDSSVNIFIPVLQEGKNQEIVKFPIGFG